MSSIAGHASTLIRKLSCFRLLSGKEKISLRVGRCYTPKITTPLTQQAPFSAAKGGDRSKKENGTIYLSELARKNRGFKTMPGGVEDPCRAERY